MPPPRQRPWRAAPGPLPSAEQSTGSSADCVRERVSTCKEEHPVIVGIVMGKGWEPVGICQTQEKRRHETQEQLRCEQPVSLLSSLLSLLAICFLVN